MLGALEDLAAVSALALEHATSVVQAMAEHVQIGFVPGHELAVVPDDPFEPVIGLGSHWSTPSPHAGAFAAVMAHFPRLFQHFASAGNTRYDFLDRQGRHRQRDFAAKKHDAWYDRFVCRMVFVT